MTQLGDWARERAAEQERFTLYRQEINQHLGNIENEVRRHREALAHIERVYGMRLKPATDVGPDPDEGSDPVTLALSAAARQAAGEDIEPGSDDPDFYRNHPVDAVYERPE